ncbi:MAG: serine/threonine protein kinase [candidate division WOR-3 bacterium]|nr:serine/threonine protein kinase [candidate division WOR-3 bacterium]MCX7947305.1 serine/threonine protein kinase [candidate division WOR-3 bacterium]MDW8150138.1 serine/threonine-protein kinase [candidate division WOR-3 bacterium]
MHKNLFANKVFSGKYLLKEEIAVSPIFHVYKAVHQFLHKDVIVKILRIDLIRDQKDVQILKEIAGEILEQIRHITALESHPNINWILDIDKEMEGKIFYFVVDYLEEDLRSLVKKKGKLSLEDALRITEDILNALVYAHGHGIAHKNLKPENIRFKDGNVVITDFGLGHIAQKAIRRLKLSGFLSAPVYISPRVLRGLDITPYEADLYSVGALLYYMLTGKPPYDEEDIARTHAEKLSNKLELPRYINQNIPEKVERFILKALEMEDETFNSASEMLEELYLAFSEVQNFLPYIITEIRNGKRIKREVYINETFDAKITEIQVPIFIASGSEGEINIKFNNLCDYVIDITVNPQVKFDGGYKSNKREFVLKLTTPKDYYGTINIKVQVKDKLSNHLIKQPIEIPILVLPTEDIEKEVTFNA